VTTAPVAVLGMGLWMPGVPDPAAWGRGEVVRQADAPPGRLPATLRRRASLLINMAAEVAAQATEQAQLSLGNLPMVVGSAFGELGTMMAILHAIEGNESVSPTHFQGSVHNSAAGYLSIAHGNQVASTSIAAGNDTVAMVLLEAVTQLAARGGAVLAMVADEELPAVLVPVGRGRALAAALVLANLPADAPAGAGPRPIAVIDQIRKSPEPAPRNVEGDAPCATILPLIAAIQALAAGGLASTDVGLDSWVVSVRPWEIP
jgi:hypothetical protein